MNTQASKDKENAKVINAFCERFAIASRKRPGPGAEVLSWQNVAK